MKNAFLHLLAIAVFASLLSAAAGCQYPDEFVEVGKEGDFKMEVPPYFHKHNDLSENAVLQYGSYFRNFYVVVLEAAPKSGFSSLEGYCRAETGKLLKPIRKTVRNDSTGLQVGGLPAIQLGYTGLVGTDKLNEFVTYKLVFVEAEDRFYQICLWTWEKHRERFAKDMDKIIASFQTL